MSQLAPVLPELHHVWVHGTLPAHGQPRPGLVIGWQAGQERTRGRPAWWALVAIRYEAGLVVEWVPATHLAALRDPLPRPARPARRATRGVRHAWLQPHRQQAPIPALVVDWHLGGDGWQAHLAQAQPGHGSLFLSWFPAASVRPVTDDAPQAVAGDPRATPARTH